jgi:hypothetical protein
MCRETTSLLRIGKSVREVTGKVYAPERLGSLDDLNREISRQKAALPGDSKKWGGAAKTSFNGLW